ncbi:unnamed protein product [Darwinula stevensoni]|uniref:RRM domain-containing protein n=1 Tax=Darwinula stevensoni TaxID=69355 RepID=A0A7R8XB36_9CRUS|nr:unnamed protein product [Darwinula stevensoni]CAG0887330.1 unnamed protein product [Darwinula stevensoni]
MAENARLFVGGVVGDVSEEDLHKEFGKMGNIIDIHVGSTFAFIQYEDAQDADDAVAKYDGAELFGNKVHVTIARPREDRFRGRGRGGFRGRGDSGGFRGRGGFGDRGGYRGRSDSRGGGFRGGFRRYDDDSGGFRRRDDRYDNRDRFQSRGGFRGRDDDRRGRGRGFSEGGSRGGRGGFSRFSDSYDEGGGSRFSNGYNSSSFGKDSSRRFSRSRSPVERGYRTSYGDDDDKYRRSPDYDRPRGYGRGRGGGGGSFRPMRYLGQSQY